MRLMIAVLFLLPAVSMAGSLTATGAPVTRFTDGRAIDVPIAYVLFLAPEGEPLVETARSNTPTVTVTSLAPGRWCAQFFAVNGNVYADGRPATPWCGTVPAAPSQTPTPSRKPEPIGNVTFTTAAE